MSNEKSITGKTVRKGSYLIGGYSREEIESFYAWLKMDRQRTEFDLNSDDNREKYKICCQLDSEIQMFSCLSNDEKRIIFYCTYAQYKEGRFISGMLTDLTLDSMEKIKAMERILYAGKLYPALVVEQKVEEEVNYSQAKKQKNKTVNGTGTIFTAATSETGSDSKGGNYALF